MPTSDFLYVVNQAHLEVTQDLERYISQRWPDTRYMIVIVDPPEVIERRASFFGSFIKSDARLIFQRIVDQLSGF